MSSFFLRKTRVLKPFVLLCVSLVCMHVFSSAHAAPVVLQSGVSGTCTWKYEQEANGDIVFKIVPTNGKEGELDRPSPYYDDYLDPPHRHNTKRIVINEGKVKTPSDTGGLFEGFKNVEGTDFSGLDVSEMSSAIGMFASCESLTTLDVSKWNVSNLNNAVDMFLNCKALTTLDVSGWNVPKLDNMNSMFYGCEALTSLDLSRWRPRSGIFTSDAFGAMKSLAKISLGSGFSIEKGAFGSGQSDETAQTLRTKWRQVNLGEGGTEKNPKGKTFKSPREIVDFHNDSSKRKTDVEEYVRLVTLAYSKAENAPASLALSRQSEEVPATGASLGCEVTGVEPGKTIKWTVAKGGNDSASTWSCTKAKLEAEDIEAAAKKNGVLVDTTFTAELISLAHAAPVVLQSGVSGTCTWKYEQETNGDIVFKIVPTNGKEGELDARSWRASSHRDNTKRIVINEGKVKTPSDTVSLFEGFENVEGTDFSGLDVSEMSSAIGMFGGCKSLTTLDVSKWNVSNLHNAVDMFLFCKALTTLDVSGWNVSKLKNMNSMFYGCEALTSLDLSRWRPRSGISTSDAFGAMKSLAKISLGSGFSIEKGAFGSGQSDETAQTLRTKWRQVNLGEGGTEKNPKGKTFKSPREIVDFHNDSSKRKTDVEEYVRLVTLAYSKAENAPASLALSRQSEEVPATGASLGCEVTGVEPGKTIKWTIAKGGNDSASTWSCTKAKLEAEDIEAAAKKNGVLVDTTFTAELIATSTIEPMTKTYTITLKENIPPGASFTGVLTQPDPVEHGKKFVVPGLSLVWKDHIFKGWNTESDGTGTSYEVNQEIKVESDITLYAQWEDAVTLTYIKKDPAESGFTLSRSSETLGVSDEPSGCKVTGVDESKTIKWTVTKGGNDSASTWSCTKAKLEAEDIKAAAKKDKKLVATTFEVQLMTKTYTITLKENIPPGASFTGVLTQPDPVEHGKTFVVPGLSLVWKDHIFKGWNTESDGTGISYAVNQEIEVKSDITLYAQWEDVVTLTYKIKGSVPDGVSLSLESEQVALDGVPKGCEVTGVDESKTIKWTVTKGGNDQASTWSCTKAKLEVEDIEAAAKKDKKLVATTFEVQLMTKTYTITLKENIPSGASFTGVLTQPASVEHGKTFVVPGLSLVVKDRIFKGWNTESGGTGISYKVNQEIKVKSDITLYAQWEDAVTLTYKIKGSVPDGVSLSLGSEQVALDGVPKGCEVTGVDESKTIKWTVTKGGNDQASTWSCTKAKLEVEDIEAAAKKDKKLVATTFEVQLMTKTYTITLKENIPSGASFTGVLTQPAPVEHGKTFVVPGLSLVVKDRIFKGWNTESGGTGISYKVNQEIKVKSDITLYAQWEDAVTLTYKIKGSVPSGVSLSLGSEQVALDGVPKGCEVTGVDESKTIKWTVTKGGNDSASTWSCTKAKLEVEDIEAAAKKDKKLVATTFEVQLMTKTYTITLKENIPPGVSFTGVLTQPAPVKHGKTFVVPGLSLVWKDHIFKGWNTKENGTGTSYEVKQEIKVESDITLYAQWKNAIMLTYKIKGSVPSGVSLSLQSEQVALNEEPKGCEVTGVDESKTIKWTVTEGGNDSASTWSCTKAKLEAEDIKAAAKKDKKLVATTFEVEILEAPKVVGPPAPKVVQPPAPKVVKPDPTSAPNVKENSSASTRSSSSGVSKPKREASSAPSRDIKTPAQQAPGWRPSTEGGAQKWYFYGKDGKKLLGQHQLVGGKNGQLNWFYFDEKTGEQVRGWKHFDHQKKWCYYSTEDGAMLKGQHELKGGNDGGKHWFYFDEVTGAQIRGWKPIAYQNKLCYYSEADGRMLKGQHELEGGIGGGKHWFYFDEVTGAQIRGWKPIAYQNKWCYYSDADGTMLKGQHELEGGDAGGKYWFYFDEETGAELRNCWKEIPSQSKICYYGSDGAMYKGWCVVAGTLYYFDEETGARR